MIIEGIGSRRLTFRSSANYIRQIRFRFNNLHSVGYLATDVVAATALQNGWAPVHCGAVSIGSRTILLLAAPDSGKTLTSLMLARIAGSQFVAEDLAFTNGTELAGCTGTSTFRYYDEFMGRRDKVLARATQLLPPAEMLRGKAPAKVDAVLPGVSVARAPCRVTDVIILERREGRNAQLSESEALERALRFNRYEFRYLTSPVTAAANYFSGCFPQEELIEMERRLIGQLTSRCPTYVIRESDPRNFASSILDIVKPSDE